MPKVGGPLFSPDAHGDLGKLLNFHRRPSGHAVARHHEPGSNVTAHKEPSASQIVIRGYVGEAVDHWRQLSPAEKTQWNEYVNS